MRIYVAGPYTKGDVVVNIRNAIFAADILFASGHTPYVPHLMHLWHTVCPHPWVDWIRLDLVWLAQCDAVLRLPGKSDGADIEIAEAGRLRIPVYLRIEDVPRGHS